MTTRLLTLLTGLLGLCSLSCEHPRATATGLPVLYVPPDAPTEEPPPAPLIGQPAEAPSTPNKPAAPSVAEVGEGKLGSGAASGPDKPASPEAVVQPSSKLASGASTTEIACDGEVPSARPKPE